MNFLTIEQCADKLALIGFEIGAIKINAKQPFEWASGTFNPIYNDNRLFLRLFEYRQLIIRAFTILWRETGDKDWIAGTSTAGIPHGASLADHLKLPFSYVRDEPKKHGLKNQIEGIPDEQGYGKRTVLLIEDLVSTGGSSVKAVQAIRDADGVIDDCFSIFSYGLPKAEAMFAGTVPFSKDGEKRLITPCRLHSILTYDRLIEIGIENNYIDADQFDLLKKWQHDQSNWGANHGFPPTK